MLAIFVVVPFCTVLSAQQDPREHNDQVRLPEAVAETDTAAADPLDELDEQIKVGEYRSAEKLAATIAESPELLLRRARILRETGRGPEALRLLLGAAAYEEGNPALRCAAGALRDEIGDRSGAKADLERALALDPLHIEARARLGLILIVEGKRKKGEAHLQQLIEQYEGLSPEDAEQLPPSDFVWFGKACEGLRRFQEAYSVMYESALELDRESVEALIASGDAFITKYNYPDARTFFKDAIAVNPRSAEARIGLAAAILPDHSFKGDRRASVAAELKAAAEVWPEHPRALLVTGDLAFEVEDWKTAEESYRRALDQDPLSLSKMASLAAVYFVNFRMPEYEAVTQHAHQMHAAPAEFYGRLATILVDRFFYREGMELAEKAIEVDPDYWPAYATFGINAMRCRRVEDGREALEKAWSFDRFNVWVKNTRLLLEHMDREFIEKTTDHFVFRYSRTDAPYILPYLEALLEETRQRFERQYQVDLGDVIDVEGFSDHQYFSARSIGLPGLSAAGVCFGTLVTLTTPKAIPENWGAIAVHEYMHVVSLRLTKHRIPRWFTEGLSVFEEGRHQPRWRRVFAAPFVDAVHHGRLLPIRDLQSGFMSGETIMLAYFQGGQICQFIHDVWGFDEILAMLDAYRRGRTTEQVLREVLEIEPEEFDRRFLARAREIADSYGIWCRWGPEHIEALRRAVERNPSDIESLVKLGFAYLAANKPTDVELTVGKALKVDERHADLSALRGFLAARQQKGKAAIPHLDLALERGTNYRYLAHAVLGALHAAAKNVEQAILHLRKAIEIHPDGTGPIFDRPSPYAQLSKLLNAEGREAEAIEVLERLISVDRTELKSRKAVASWYQAREEWGKVVAALEDAVFINPYDAEVHEMLARGFVATEAYRSAIRELQVLQMYTNAPFDWIYGELAWCHLKLGDAKLAEELARQALGVNPQCARAKEVLETTSK